MALNCFWFCMRSVNCIFLGQNQKHWQMSMRSRERCVCVGTHSIHIYIYICFILSLLCLFLYDFIIIHHTTHAHKRAHAITAFSPTVAYPNTHTHNMIHSFQACTYWAIRTFKREANSCKRTHLAAIWLRAVGQCVRVCPCLHRQLFYFCLILWGRFSLPLINVCTTQTTLTPH